MYIFIDLYFKLGWKLLHQSDPTVLTNVYKMLKHVVEDD